MTRSTMEPTGSGSSVLMRSTMQEDSPDTHVQMAEIWTEGGTMDPMRRDVRAAMTGRAHSDAYPDDREAGRRNGVTRRTACRWSHEGPPQARSFQRYLFNAPNPYPILADTQAAVKARFKSGQTTEELIRDFHALRAQEKAVEGEDNGVDCSRGPTMLDRALMKQRDAAINLELAAILRLLAERRVTEDDLMAGVG